MKTLRRVILDESKNAKKQRAALAAKIQKRGGPENEREDDIVLRQNAREHGVKPNAPDFKNKKDFIGRFRPKEGQHARHMQTGMTAQERATKRGVEDTVSYKTGRVKARQIVRRGGKIPAPTGQELNDLTSRTRANEPPRGRGDRVKKVGPSGRKDETAYPLTADRVHIHEINIVKGKLASGNGTRLKVVGPLTKAAIRRREAGQETPASKKSLEMAKTSATNAAAKRPSKFDGPRIRTKAKKPVKPNTEPLPKGFEGGIAGSTEDIQNQIARRGHSR